MSADTLTQGKAVREMERIVIEERMKDSNLANYTVIEPEREEMVEQKGKSFGRFNFYR